MAKQHITKKPRGRPQGTGKDDSAALAAVADMVIASEAEPPAISPSSAMKRCVKGLGNSHLRRLQVKWKAESNRLKEEARGRARAKVEACEKARKATTNFGSAGSACAAMLAAAADLNRYDSSMASEVAQHALAASKLMESQFETGGLAAMTEIHSKVMGSSGLWSGQSAAAAAGVLGMTEHWSPSCMPEILKSLEVSDYYSRLAQDPIVRAMREMEEAMDRADPSRWLRR